MLSQQCGSTAHRLVAVLLETCGQYFGKGAVAKRLDRFLAYLQRYVLSKPVPPLDVSLDLEVLLATAALSCAAPGSSCSFEFVPLGRLQRLGCSSASVTSAIASVHVQGPCRRGW